MDLDTQRIEDHRLLQESLGLVAPVADDLIATFYAQLFEDYPQVRPMFPAIMDLQRERLLAAIIAVVTHYDHPERLMPALTAMGRAHAGYGVEPAHFDAVGITLMSTLRLFAGDAWNSDYEGAWGRMYVFVSSAMIEAANAVASDSGQIAA